MPSVTISLDEIRAEQLGDEARAQGLSVSKLVRKCVDNYFEASSESEVEHAQSPVETNVSLELRLKLEGDVKHKDEMLQEKDKRIDDLNDGLNFLRLQYAELIRQNALLLPVPVKSEPEERKPRKLFLGWRVLGFRRDKKKK